MKTLDILSKLVEGTMVTDKMGKTTYVNNEPDSNSLRTDPNIKTATTTQGRKLKEVDLDEMARIPSKYKLADDWRAKLSAAPDKVQNSKTVKFIMDYAGEHPEWQILDIAKAYGEYKGDPKFARQQMFNPVVKDIMEPLGLIEPISGEALTKPRNRFDKEKKDLGDENDYEEDSDNELSQYFDVSKGKDKDEFDEPEEVEPDLPTQKFIAPTNARSKAAEFFFANDRLLQKIINTQLQARTKVKKAVNEDDVKDNYYSQERNRVINSGSQLDILIDEYVGLIKQEELDVQRAIIEMLEHKLPGNLRNLYNKVVKAVGDIPYKNQNSFKDDEDEFTNDIEFDFEEDDIEDTLDESLIRQFKLRAGLLK
jgi:hypothetical protein